MTRHTPRHDAELEQNPESTGVNRLQHDFAKNLQQALALAQNQSCGRQAANQNPESRIMRGGRGARPESPESRIMRRPAMTFGSIARIKNPESRTANASKGGRPESRVQSHAAALRESEDSGSESRVQNPWHLVEVRMIGQNPEFKVSPRLWR